MSDWLEELTQKLLGMNSQRELTTVRTPEKEVLVANGLFSKAPFLSSYRLQFLSVQKSGLEGLGPTPCYARVEISGIADSAHLFVPYDHLKSLCGNAFGEAAAEDSDFLSAFFKFFLVEYLFHMHKHPLLMGCSASLIECHIGVALEHFKTFKPASSVDLICLTENESVRLPLRIIFSPAFEASWREKWKTSEGAQNEYLDQIKKFPVNLQLQAAFVELSHNDIAQLEVGDWIVLEKVGFDSSQPYVTVMIVAEGIQIGVGTFNGEELKIRELSPSPQQKALQQRGRQSQNPRMK
ncbi:hypothetical protein [Candidatus Similichlamydia epinepheli]|uniref:hypothetical protein n=1 Tax=Candidatus Similichlamydia epinepheli TaxID=1903953 RepID=UPI000D357FAC|nr:hypothetical protein [Candidatus Similichlamydia epinepheli]